MGNRVGSNVGLYFGIEDSFGAGQAVPNLFRVPRAALRMQPVRGMDESPEINEVPGPGEPTEGLIELNGEFGLIPTADNIALFLEWFCGNRACTPGTPNVHVSKIVANAVKSAVFARYDAGNAKEDVVKGAVAASMKLSWRKNKGPLILTFGVQGIGAAATRNSGSRFDAAPTTLTDKKLSLVNTSLTIDGSGTLAALVTGLDLSITWQVFLLNALTGYIYQDGVDVAGPAIQASMTCRRASADSVYALCNDAAHAFVLKTTRPGAATRYFQTTLPEAKVGQPTADESQKAPVDETFPIFPFFLSNAKSTPVEFETANDQAAY